VRIIPFVLLVFLLLSKLALAQSEGGEGPDVRRDAQTWNYYELAFRVHKKWQLNFKNQIRLNENMTRFDYTAFNFEANYRAARWLRVSGSYRFNIKNHWRDGWLNRHQVRATASLRHRIGDFKFYNRNRIQTGVEDAFSESDETDSNLFYRNRTRVKWTVTERWDVYGFFEAYWRLGKAPVSEGLLYRKRYSVGANYVLSSRESLRVFAVYQDQVRRRRPDQRYVLGIGYTRTFKTY